MKKITKSFISIEGYEEILNDIRSLLEKAKSQTFKIVDNLRVQTYWQIGERIAREEFEHKERADYGKQLIQKLALDLGFKDRRSIYYMLQFYKAYPIVTTVCSQLSWSHYRELILIQNQEERNFYEQQALLNSWSFRDLEKAIQDNLYNSALKEDKIIATTPTIQANIQKIFKETYNFEFLELENGYSEKQLENGLLSNVEKLLLEFGHDFSLTGHQRKILIDQQIHSIDIEFYHRGIPCIILVDLKIGKFRSEYVGQMNKYINYYRENKMYSWEKPPIGLIVCEDKGVEEVHYALGYLQNKIFVAEYKTKLPSETEIKNALQKIKQ